MKEFAGRQSCIVKPIRSGKVEIDNENRLIYTNLIKDKDVDQMELTPCIIQGAVEKQFEIRATVIHRSVFAAKIDSQINPEEDRLAKKAVKIRTI